MKRHNLAGDSSASRARGLPVHPCVSRRILCPNIWDIRAARLLSHVLDSVASHDVASGDIVQSRLPRVDAAGLLEKGVLPQQVEKRIHPCPFDHDAARVGVDLRDERKEIPERRNALTCRGRFRDLHGIRCISQDVGHDARR